MNILIDANILIPMEPGSHEDIASNTPLALRFQQLASKSGTRLYVHPVIFIDIGNDSNAERLSLRKTLLDRYNQLPSPPSVDILDVEAVGTPAAKSNDWVDNNLLASVYGNAVDYLVTEDIGIHRKAARLGIDSRVMFLSDAITMLHNLFDIAPSPPPAVYFDVAHSLDSGDPIFESLRNDYTPFDNWLDKCKREHRDIIVIKPDQSKKLAGLCILKQEDCLPDGRKGKTLKLCTFKVSDDYSGYRFGELLLKAVFEYAKSNSYRYIFFTAKPHQEHLLLFASDFGFNPIDPIDMEEYPGELISAKEMFTSEADVEGLTPLELYIKYGPNVSKFDDNSTFIIPILPKYHEILFPEAQNQRVLFPGSYPCGNSIKKAYLSNSNIKSIDIGDNVLFYRSDDLQSLSALGIVDGLERSDSPETITRFVGKRTVYTYDQIQKLCRKETLAIKFRMITLIDPPVKLGVLIKNGIISAAPQSITKAKNVDVLRRLLNL